MDAGRLESFDLRGFLVIVVVVYEAGGKDMVGGKMIHIVEGVAPECG